MSLPSLSLSLFNHPKAHQAHPSASSPDTLQFFPLVMTVPRSEQFRSRVTAGKMGKINDGMGWGGTGWRDGNGTLSDMSTEQRGRTTGVQVHAKQITGRGKKTGACNFPRIARLLSPVRSFSTRDRSLDTLDN